MAGAAKPVPRTSIDLDFGDGTYTFKLGLRQIAELQTKCDCGIGEVYARVLAGRFQLEGATIENHAAARYHIEDIVETIRLGLIGGASGEVNGAALDVTPLVATRLINVYVPDTPLMELWATAVAVLNALIVGYSDKKKEPDLMAETIDGSTTPAPSPTVL